MDYEAPLMPCGCILLHLPHIPGTGSMPRTQGEGEALVASSRALTWGLGLSCCPGFQPGKAAGAHAAKLRGGWESSWVPGDTGGCWDRGVPGPTPLVG